MHLKIFLQQLKRGKKTGLYILLLMVVVAFFVMSINLYHNSRANLQTVEENYSTIALMELYGEIDEYGNLVSGDKEQVLGYESVTVEGFDFSKIVDTDCVTHWDLRSRYGAYIENHVSMQGKGFPMLGEDVLRFRIAEAEPVVLPVNWEEYDSSNTEFKVEIIDSAAGCYAYPDEWRFGNFSLYSLDCRNYYAEQVKQLNRNEDVDYITLYPNEEYVMVIGMGSGWYPSEEQGLLRREREDSALSLYSTFSRAGALNYRVDYSTANDFTTYTQGPEAGEFFPLQRWEDVQNNTEMKIYFEEIQKGTQITNHAFSVTTTNDFEGIAAYHLGGASLKEGRLITEEEYASGAKVCLISDQMASYQQWEIGDKLPMKFFEYSGFVNRDSQTQWDYPVWNRQTEEFFHEAEYEIVGIYTQNEVSGNSDISKTTLAMPWFNIYVPDASVENQPPMEERPVHGGLFTIHLLNGSIDEFNEHITALGLLEEKEGQFNPKFSFYDQGYSVVQPGLEAMNGTAKLLLALSSLLLLVTCVLLAFFFAQNQKQSVGIFRMLGGSKRKALTAVLICALVLTVIGAVLGGILGFGLAEFVGENINKNNLAQSQDAATYQAYVLQSSNGQMQDLAVKADLLLTVVSTAASMIFPMMLILFVLLYINQEPRELLPKSGG